MNGTTFSERKVNSRLGLFAAKKPKIAPATRHLLVADLNTASSTTPSVARIIQSLVEYYPMGGPHMGYPRLLRASSRLFRGVSVLCCEMTMMPAALPSPTGPRPLSTKHRRISFLTLKLLHSPCCAQSIPILFSRLHDSSVLSLPGAELPALPPSLFTLRFR